MKPHPRRPAVPQRRAIERDEVVAYFHVIIQDIADAKARSWRFMAVLIAITGALLSMDVVKFTPPTKELLVAGHLLAAWSTIFMTCNSQSHIDHRREILDRLYTRWPAVKNIRDPQKKISVRKSVVHDLKHIVQHKTVKKTIQIDKISERYNYEDRIL